MIIVSTEDWLSKCLLWSSRKLKELLKQCSSFIFPFLSVMESNECVLVSSLLHDHWPLPCYSPIHPDLSSNKRLWTMLKSHKRCHMYWNESKNNPVNHIASILLCHHVKQSQYSLTKLSKPLPSISVCPSCYIYCYLTIRETNHTLSFINASAVLHFPIHALFSPSQTRGWILFFPSPNQEVNIFFFKKLPTPLDI